MRYVVRTFIAMVLFAFCWAAIAYSIYQLLQVGHLRERRALRDRAGVPGRDRVAGRRR